MLRSPDTVRVTHVIAGLDPAHGGPSYTVPRLCAALAEAGAKVALLSVALRDAGLSDVSADGYRNHRFPWDYAGVPVLGQLRYSSGLARASRSAHGEAQGEATGRRYAPSVVLQPLPRARGHGQDDDHHHCWYYQSRLRMNSVRSRPICSRSYRLLHEIHLRRTIGIMAEVVPSASNQATLHHLRLSK